jgi:hypothetical protein
MKLIDHRPAKEINHRLLLGDNRHPSELKPLVDNFAAATVARNIRPAPAPPSPATSPTAGASCGYRQLPLLRAGDRRPVEF